MSLTSDTGSSKTVLLRAIDRTMIVTQRQRQHLPRNKALPSHCGFIERRDTPRSASGALTMGVNPSPPIPPGSIRERAAL